MRCPNSKAFLQWSKILDILLLSHSFRLYLRYKYLEKMHEEEMNKILVYLKGFTAPQRKALAQITALWLASGQLPATILPILINVSLKAPQYSYL